MPATVARPARAKRGGLERRDARTGFALLSPTLIVVVLAVVVPLLWSVLISFQELRLIQIGIADPFAELTLQNYERVLGSDALWSSLGTTFAYTFGAVMLSTALGLIAALALRRPFRGRAFVRAVMLLPYVAPIVAVTFVWRTMLNPQFGLINAVGQAWLGWAAPIPFLTQAEADWNLLGLEIPVPVALLSVIAFEGWRYFPFAFLFILARLSALSAESEEAALVDGAGPWQTFRYIIWPQLVPIVGVLIVLRTIWTFNDFDDIFLLTGGAAGTQVASIRMYELLRVQEDVGAASAQSVVMAAILIAMLSVYLLILRRQGAKP